MIGKSVTLASGNASHVDVTPSCSELPVDKPVNEPRWYPTGCGNAAASKSVALSVVKSLVLLAPRCALAALIACNSVDISRNDGRAFGSCRDAIDVRDDERNDYYE